LIRIRIHGFYDQKFKKNLQLKKIKFLWIKTTIYLSLGLKREHPAIQNTFSTSAGNFCPPGSRSGLDSKYGSRSGSTDLIEPGSETLTGRYVQGGDDIILERLG
jgi:hypothetical protein